MLLCIPLGTAKVNQLDHSLGGDHDVGTLDVTVDDAIVVQIVNSPGNLPGIVTDGALIKRPKPMRGTTEKYFILYITQAWC